MNNPVESPEAVGFSSKRLARIKPIMQSYVDGRGFAGVSTMLARRGRKEEIIGIFMTQFMVAFDLPDKDFQVLAYQALVE